MRPATGFAMTKANEHLFKEDNSPENSSGQGWISIGFQIAIGFFLFQLLLAIPIAFIYRIVCLAK